jgi:[protein-PII] uridylyltransferase
MEQRGFIAAAERKQIEAAYDFLLRARNELHYHTNRAVDVLTRNLQPPVAWHLGYTDRSPRRRVEDFMRDLYMHSRNIYLITRTLEDRLALAPRSSRLPSLRKLISVPFRQPVQEPVDGFRFVDGQLRFDSPRVFKEQPRRLMRAFLYAQQRDLKLHPDLAQLMRSELSLVERGFLKDEHVRETFLQILNQRGNVARILRAMHDVGFLGKYIPEFGKLTCLVQHEFYHQYAADEHTLIASGALGMRPRTNTPKSFRRLNGRSFFTLRFCCMMPARQTTRAAMRKLAASWRSTLRAGWTSMAPPPTASDC